MDHFIQFLREYAPISPLIPLLVSLFRWRKLTKEHKALWLMVVVAAIVQTVSSLWGKYAPSGNNFFMYHIYIVLELAILARVFWVGVEGLMTKERYLMLIGVFAGLAMLNVIFLQAPDTMPSHTRTLESLILSGLALRYFFLVLKELKIYHLEKSFMFWVSTAILLYFLGNLLLFIYGGMVSTQDDKTYFEIYAIHSFLNILLYSLYSVALCLPLQPRSSLKYS